MPIYEVYGSRDFHLFLLPTNYDFVVCIYECMYVKVLWVYIMACTVHLFVYICMYVYVQNACRYLDPPCQDLDPMKWMPKLIVSWDFYGRIGGRIVCPQEIGTP